MYLIKQPITTINLNTLFNRICLNLTFILIVACPLVLFAQIGNGFNPCPMKADIWILAGQSNMAGNGRTPDTATNPKIWMMNMDNRWKIAKCPLHRDYEASAFAYEKDMYQLLPKSEQNWAKFERQYEQLRERSKLKPIGRVGPGIYFARNILQATNNSVALIPCALGGSSMEQWDPAKKSLGDSSLYGATINRIKATGANVKGILWYQGESEGMMLKSKNYEKDFLMLIDSFRSDLGNPDLSFIYVQIGKFNIRDTAMGSAWEQIREMQRDVLKKRKNVYMVTGIDLPLDDCVHIASEGQKRLGRRLADMALTYVYKLPGHATQINLDNLKLCWNKITESYFIKVHYSGVCRKLRSAGLPSQFALRINSKENISYVVSKVILDPEDDAGVDVYLSRLPETSAQLVSGEGTYPYMNITDSMNNAIPAFGPVNIPLKLDSN